MWQDSFLGISIWFFFYLFLNFQGGIFINISNLLFCIGSVFFIHGLMRLLANLHMFDSFIWGTKGIKHIYQRKENYNEYNSDRYIAFRNRKSKKNSLSLLLTAFLFFVSSSFFVFIGRIE